MSSFFIPKVTFTVSKLTPYWYKNKIIKGKIINYDNVDHEYLEFDANWILSLAQIIQILYKKSITRKKVGKTHLNKIIYYFNTNR